MAERTGILRSITRLVLAQALADCAAWRAAGHDLSVVVNLSTIDLLDLDLAHEVAALIAEHGVPAGSLCSRGFPSASSRSTARSSPT